MAALDPAAGEDALGELVAGQPQALQHLLLREQRVGVGHREPRDPWSARSRGPAPERAERAARRNDGPARPPYGSSLPYGPLYTVRDSLFGDGRVGRDASAQLGLATICSKTDGAGWRTYGSYRVLRVPKRRSAAMTAVMREGECGDGSERLQSSDLKLIGAGLPRTGTLTQKLALEQLGLGPCYHWVNVIADLDQVRCGIARWTASRHGRRSSRGIAARVDWPGGYFYRELMDAYPEAKVLLSVRDGESWERSFRDTIWTMSYGQSLMPLLAHARARGRPALAALPGARGPHVLGSAGHVRRRARQPAQLIEQMARPQRAGQARRARGAAARVGGGRRLGAAVRVPRSGRAGRAAAARQRSRHVPRPRDRRGPWRARVLARAAPSRREAERVATRPARPRTTASARPSARGRRRRPCACPSCSVAMRPTFSSATIPSSSSP